MIKFIKLFWKELIYGGHAQCLGVVGIIYIFGFLFSVNIDFLFYVLIYLVFYLIYINDRLLSIKIDKITNKERTEYLEKHIKAIIKIIVISVLVLIFLFFYFKNLFLAITSIILVLLGLLYPKYIKGITKRILIFKNIYVALFFSLIIILPLIHYSIELNFLTYISLFSFVFFIFLKTILMQIFLDSKDIEGDKLVGLKTIPVLFGRKKTFAFLRISNIIVVSLFLLLTVFVFKIFPYQILILFFILPINFYSYKLALDKKYFGYILGSIEFFFWFLLIFIINIF